MADEKEEIKRRELFQVVDGKQTDRFVHDEDDEAFMEWIASVYHTARPLPGDFV